MSNDQLVADLADKARKASQTLITAGYGKRQGALLAIADALEANPKPQNPIRTDQANIDPKWKSASFELLLAIYRGWEAKKYTS